MNAIQKIIDLALVAALALVVWLAGNAVFNKQHVPQASEYTSGSFDSVVLIRFNPPAAEVDKYRAECSKGCTLGSGVTLDGGLIVTASHVITEGGWKVGDTLTVLDFQNVEHAVTLEKVDKEDDLAVLRYVGWVSGPTAPLLCNGAYAVGDEVVARGGPLFLGLLTTIGRIIRLPHPPGPWVEFASYVVFDAAVTHGNSGGPLFDRYGRVVGIVDRLILDDSGSDGNGFRLAIPAPTVCALVYPSSR